MLINPVYLVDIASCIFFAFLFLFGKRRLNSLLEKKIESIEYSIKDAEERSAKAHVLLAKQQNRKAEIEKQIAGITAEAKREIERIALYAKQQEDQEVARYTNLARQSIDALQRDCVEEFLKFNVNIAIQIIMEFLHDRLDDEDFQTNNIDLNIIKKINNYN
jgi:F0F1-type ATP synthase membrane subunit b/b'